MIGCQRLGDRRPQTGVAHQSWGGRQIAAIEVKANRRDRVDETVQRAVVDCSIPATDRLLLQNLSRAKAMLNRQKSISSQTASISAWYTDLDWSSMVLRRHLFPPRPANRIGGAGTPRRSSNGSAAQSPFGRHGAWTAPRRGGVGQGAQPGGVPVRLHDVDRRRPSGVGRR